MAGVFSRLRQSLTHAWNAFSDEDSFKYPQGGFGGGGSFGGGYMRPDRIRFRYSAEKTIIASIYTRLGIDVSGINIVHVNTDADGCYLSERQSGLNNCLKVEPNIDQGARQFRQEIAEVLFDKGVCAIVPVDTTADPTISNAFDVQTLRVGEIINWFPQHVRVLLYNEAVGYREEITLPKQAIAIVQNPLYSVMNEPNSTLQRLIAKLNMLDAVDEASSSGKLDLIIQLPYVIKSEARRQQAIQRRTDLEEQLKGNTYGIAYADGTEKITQLNRPAENNLLAQVQYLTSMVYAELGLTDSIMNGTADESTMLNYIDRTIKPVLDAITEAMKRSFLSKTARSQGQSIMYFRDPFNLVPLSQFAEIADILSRNEVATPNELRGVLGWKPSKDPKADKLQNSNMPQPQPPTTGPQGPPSSANPSAVFEASAKQAVAKMKQQLAIEPGGNSQNGS
jgi:hypothetical protein